MGTDLPGGTFTANVTFYPKVNAIVVNKIRSATSATSTARFCERLPPRRSAIRSGIAPSEQDRAKVYCGNGGKIAFASEADVAALERAAEPVYEALEADPQTKELIAQFRRMRGGVLRRPRPRAGGMRGAKRDTLDHDWLRTLGVPRGASTASNDLPST